MTSHSALISPAAVAGAPTWADRTAQLAELVTRDSRGREMHTVRAPFTGEAIGAVPMCTEADVNAALRRARRGQQVWARRSFAERSAIFMRYHDLVLSRQKALLDLLQLESGKARRHALEEAFDVALNARHYAARAYDYLHPRKRKGALPFFTQVEEHHLPVGVVGIIAPWNYPLTLAVSDAIPALLAGNAVILKPASETPFIALLAMQLLREAGLPHEVFQIVTGSGRTLAPALIQGIDFLGFTGSTATGRIVAQQAAERLIKYSMELGGKNPALVLDDTSLNRAVAGVVNGSFSNAGQLCIAFERVYVQRGIYDRFVPALAEQVRALRLGASMDYEADMGALIGESQFNKVVEHVQDAVDKGATVLTGGRARPDLGPYFYEPTVLADVTPEMAVFAEETFGPVISVYRFDRVEEAVEAANASPYGLNAAVWSRDVRRAQKIARQIKCGTVNINEGYGAAWASIDAPMGGMKDSGVGRRHGAEGILKYTESQTIAAQHLIPLAPSRLLPPKTFALVMTLVLYLMKRIPGLR